MKPPHPANEEHRLEVLQDYSILDTPAEAEFDALTRLAAHVCQAPIALISIVDVARLWFKSRVGLETSQIDRDVSFCGHAILQPDPLVIGDATKDARFADNPLVTRPPRIRAYAGIPILTPEGTALGTLCVMDTAERTFTPTQIETLKQLATIIRTHLDHLRQLRRADHQTQQTVKLARTVVELQTEVHRRRTAEEESRRYADLVQNIQLGLAVWRLEEAGNPKSFRLIAVNPAASRASGIPMDALVGKPMAEVLPHFLQTDLPQRFIDVIVTGAAMDLGLFTYEDERITRRDFRVRAFPLPHQSVGIAFENVTDQRLLEQAQLENQARKAAILDSAPDAIVTIDFEGKVFEWNQAAERIFGHRRPAVLGKELAALVFTPGSRDRFRATLATYIRTGQSPLVGRRLEITARRADGSEFPAEISVGRVARDGAPIFTGFIRDITERRRFEEALRASQALYSSLVESLPQNVFRKDLEHRFTFANATFSATFSRRLEDIIGRSDFDFFPPAAATRLRDQDRRVIQTADALEAVEEVELPGVGLRHIQVVKSPICNALGTVVGIQGMFWDITERVILEEQLRQAQKMETVGQLAGGVAHDFNNLLTVIQGHASMLLATDSLQPKQTTALQHIATAADRAAHLTRQLLTFSRKQMLQPVLLDLNQLVHCLLDMLQRSLGEDVVLHTSLDPALPSVLADPVMLEQVLLNLAANARDAIPGGGQLSITTAACLLTGDDVAQRPDAQPGPHIQLSVADTGTGIPSELVARIFEPFFTTKDIGKGTGLGLATVYGIIKQHRGWITVDSEIGAGTTFHVFLPATTKPAPPTAPPPDPGTPSCGGLETILVVEDEPALRSLVRGILEHSGYTVLEAASGKAALEVWEQHPDPIDLLLTDMIMPDGVSGRELAAKLKATHPTLHILYTSGYSPDVVGANFALEEGVNFLAKPYSPRQLAETVRNCLDRTPVG